MRFFIFIVSFSIILAACKKSDVATDLRLIKVVSNNYNGNVMYTDYSYDNQGRLVSISQHENENPSYVAATISYNGNDITIINLVNTDPIYIQSNEVKLSIGSNGKVSKRIGTRLYTGAFDPTARRYIYDTTYYTYDGDGLVKQRVNYLYDSSWYAGTNYTAYRMTLTFTFTNSGRNVTKVDEHFQFAGFRSDNGVMTQIGGSSDNLREYFYTLGHPNRFDFKNAAVLSEFRSVTNYDPVIDPGYKNLPDKISVRNTNKDLNGNVIFDMSGTYDIGRTYNDNRLLASDTVLTQNTQYRKNKYYYSKL